MTSNKQIAVANIVSAIISKDTSVTGHENDEKYFTRFCNGIDVYLDEDQGVVLRDQARKETQITLEELIMHVSECLDKVE